MKMIYVQYTDPQSYPPLEHGSRMLAEAGWEIVFIGTRAFGVDGMHFRPHPRISVKLLSFCPPGALQKAHYLFFVFFVLKECFMGRPFCIYASDPMACLPALLAGACLKCRIIYHEHDSPDSNKTGFFKKCFMDCRSRLSRKADLFILPHPGRFEIFAKDLDLPPGKGRVILNCPLKREAAVPKNDAVSEDFWLLYHGSLVPSRLPLTVVQALRDLPRAVKLRIVGYRTTGSPGHARDILRCAAENGVADRVQLIGCVPTREELFDWVRRSDVGLSFLLVGPYDVNEAAMAGASNKPFDYLAGGLALLVADLPEWKAMYVDPGYGLACDPLSPASIAGSVQILCGNRQATRQMGERGRKRILDGDWNYETQFSPVLEALDSWQ